MPYPKDRLTELLQRRVDITLREALEELNIPFGFLLDPQINPEDFFVVGHRLGHLGGRVTGGAAVFNTVGIQTNTATLRSGLIVVQAAIVSIETAGVLRMAIDTGTAYTSSALPRRRDGQGGELRQDSGGLVLPVDAQPAAETGTAVGQLGVLASSPVYFGGGDRDPVAVLFTGPRGDISQAVLWNSRTVVISIGYHIRYREFDLQAR